MNPEPMSTNVELTIESGIPVPKPRNATGIGPALRAMGVGQSIFLPGRTPGSVQAYIYQARAFTGGEGKKFTSRTVEGGCRIWRIE